MRGQDESQPNEEELAQSAAGHFRLFINSIESFFAQNQQPEIHASRELQLSGVVLRLAKMESNNSPARE